MKIDRSVVSLEIIHPVYFACVICLPIHFHTYQLHLLKNLNQPEDLS